MFITKSCYSKNDHGYKVAEKQVFGTRIVRLSFQAECVSPYPYNSTRTVTIKSSLKESSWSLRLERAVLYELRDFNSIEYDKRFYNIVLEYANGGSLGQLLKLKGGWMLEYEASWYAAMLLKGLSHVHDRDFVQCDMKPEKLLVFNIPQVNVKGCWSNLKSENFGLAKKSGETSCGAGHEYKYRGTLHYSSPESVVFGVHEVTINIRLLGCMVLKMLLGEGGLWSRFLNVDEQCLAEMITGYEDNS